MANTGFSQAIIAYKVSRPGGAPLDINGKPISESGLRQAIFLLTGQANPDPLLYQVEGYFNAKGFISGNPTQEFDPAKCPTGLIYVLPSRLILSPGGESVVLTVYSSGPWVLDSAPAIATLTPDNGPTGFTYPTLTPGATEGQGYFIFKNTVTGATARLYVINVIDPSVWILDTGNWNDLGFWFDNGVWNY